MLLNLFWWRRQGWQVAVMAAGLAVALPAAAQQVSAPPQGPAATAKQAPSKAPAKAVPKKKAAPAPKKDSTAAQAEVEAGIAALLQGRAEAAVNHLTGAIASGNLPSTLSARALYYRGVAYRRHNKPALAISDLTNALWIKAGLTEEQRADALAQRSAAYREAGLPDQSAPEAASAKSTRTHGSASAPFAAVVPAAPAASSGGGFFATLFGGGGSATPPTASAVPTSTGTTSPANPTPRTPAASQAAPSPATTASTAQSQQPSSQQLSSGAVAAGAPGSAKPATRIVRLMPPESNLPPGFQDMPAVREVEVSTAVRPATPPGAVAKSWETATEVKAAPARKATAAGAPAAGGPATAAVAGKIHVKVAAVRSAAEARDFAKRVKAGYARELGGRSPTVETWNGGNVGTLYIVQVGPFVSAAETVQLCSRMRSDGLECRVETP